MAQCQTRQGSAKISYKQSALFKSCLTCPRFSWPHLQSLMHVAIRFKGLFSKPTLDALASHPGGGNKPRKHSVTESCAMQATKLSRCKSDNSRDTKETPHAKNPDMPKSPGRGCQPNVATLERSTETPQRVRRKKKRGSCRLFSHHQFVHYWFSVLQWCFRLRDFI